MKKWLILLAISLLAVMTLTGCACGGCMGCGGEDYADDGVIDGSTGAGTDDVTGGDKYSNADEALDGVDSIIDDTQDAIEDIMGGDNVTGGTDVPSTGTDGTRSKGY